jgi:membrane protease YdiL (CAAX protease family)
MGAVAVGRLNGLSRRKLVAWAVLVGVLIAASYYARYAVADEDDDRELLYSYATAVAALFQYGLMLGFALLIARGTDLRATFALRRPRSIGRAAWQSAAALVGIWVIGAALSPVLNAGEEQGFVPDEWEPDKALAFASNAAVVALVGPVVEELLFRGLGYTLVGAFYGTVAAVVVTALAFAAAHGLLAGLPVLFAFGVAVALLRRATASVYPSIVLHCLFNAAALAAGVTLGDEL